MDSSVAPFTAETHQQEDPTSRRKVSSTASDDDESGKGGWSAAILIIFVEMAERFSYYGLSGNLIMYLTTVLGQPTATAAKNVSNWIGVSSIFPLLGAFIADSYLGRFNTVIISSVIYFLGLLLLSLSVSVIPLNHRKMAFFIALYILALGEGGHKPCVQTFAADQFDENKPGEKEAKRSFFNWWYLGIVTGASAAIIVVIYLQDNVSWTAGFGVLTGAMGAALLVFLVGIKKYRKRSPTGSPFTTMAQVLIAAARKRRVSETRDGQGICHEDHPMGGGRPLARTKQLRFLDKAMIIDTHDAGSKSRNPWRLCPVNQVEELKLVLRLIPIWVTLLMFSVAIVQLHTYFTKQGSTMARSIGPHFRVPPAALQSLVGITILIAVPVYDRVFVPMARKITGHPAGISVLQRIGFGLFLSLVNMLVCGVVEAKRVGVAREHGLMDMPKAIVPMSIWWLLPQYIILALGDVFTIVGLQELFYDQVPESMRSLGAAAYISVVGVGSFINTAIITAVQTISAKHGKQWLGDNLNRANLHHFYWLLAGLSALFMCAYVFAAMRFVYKKVEGEDDDSKQLQLEMKNLEGGYLDNKIC